ncbi:TcaA second domain-containing protein [Staphylococcus pseudintermedius]
MVKLVSLTKQVNDKDYNKLTEIVGSGEKSISVADAKHFVEYVNEPQNKERYNKEIKKMINDLENNKSYDSKVGRITDKNDNTVIDVSKNGNRFFFLNDLAFVPNFYNVYIKEGNNTASYEFKNNGKQSEVVSNANSKTDWAVFCR